MYNTMAFSEIIRENLANIIYTYFFLQKYNCRRSKNGMSKAQYFL